MVIVLCVAGVTGHGKAIDATFNVAFQGRIVVTCRTNEPLVVDVFDHCARGMAAVALVRRWGDHFVEIVVNADGMTVYTILVLNPISVLILRGMTFLAGPGIGALNLMVSRSHAVSEFSLGS